MPSKSLHLPQLCGSSAIKHATFRPGDSQSLYQIPRSGSLKWGLEPSQQCFGVILLQFVGHHPAAPWYGSRINGRVMVASSKRTYANTPYLALWLLPVPLSPWQATADPCLHRRPLSTAGISGSVSCWGRMLVSLSSWCAQGLVCALQESLVGIAFDFNMIAPLLPSCCGFSFVLQNGVSLLFGGFQHPPVNGCSAASCEFGILAGEDECTSSTLPY